MPKEALDAAMRKVEELCPKWVFSELTRALSPPRQRGSRLDESVRDAAREEVNGTFLSRPSFFLTLDHWIEYRRELGKPLKPSTIRSQIRSKLMPMGNASMAIQCMENSMSNAWQGLFPGQVEQPMHQEAEAVDHPVVSDGREVWPGHVEADSSFWNELARRVELGAVPMDVVRCTSAQSYEEFKNEWSK